MNKKEKAAIKINEVKGNVVISKDQRGGITTHEGSADKQSKDRKKSFWERSYFVAATVLAVLGILSYFGINFLWEGKMRENKKNVEPISINKVNGDVVISQNQSGGQTAHTIINNVEKPKRSIKSFEDSIITELRKHPKAAYRFYYNPGTAEVNNLVNELDKVLIQVGWRKVHPFQRLAGPPLPNGITIQFVKQNETNTALVIELMKIPGLEVKANYVEGVSDVINIPGLPRDYEPIEGVSDILISIGPNE